MTDFFTSDTHLGHANIILHSNRPYANIGEHYTQLMPGGKKAWVNDTAKRSCAEWMTTDLIAKHNLKVRPGDTVYHLGDYGFGQTSHVYSWLRQMHGNFKFVYGNHDQVLKDAVSAIHLYADLKDRVEILPAETEVCIQGQKIMLSHYAHRVWNRSHSGVWHLYGHSHGNLPDDPNSMSFDVGVDCHDYTPLTFAEVQAIMAKKCFKSGVVTEVVSDTIT